jgi:hypothetical protein
MECRGDEVEGELFALLRNSGLRHVLVGVDSGIPENLKTYGKGTDESCNRAAVHLLQALSIPYEVGFILFHPLTTLDQLRRDLQFLASLPYCTYLTLTNRLILYEGSPLLKLFSTASEVTRLGFGFEYRLPKAAEAVWAAFRTTFRPMQGCERAIRQKEYEGQNASEASEEGELRRVLELSREWQRECLGVATEIVARIEADGRRSIDQAQEEGRRMEMVANRVMRQVLDR